MLIYLRSKLMTSHFICLRDHLLKSHEITMNHRTEFLIRFSCVILL